MKWSKKIEKEKILLVEGQDEVNFFKVLFRKKDIQNIQVIESGGNKQFNIENLSALTNISGFEKVTSLAIIQDADQDPQSRFNSICDTLRKCDLNSPSQVGSFNIASTLKVGIFIIPDGKSKGMLESLCLSTVESRETMKCVDEFMDCVEKLDKKPKNKDKSRHRAFLAAMEEDTSSLGIAAQKGYWDFDSDKLKLLLEFVKNI